MFYVELLWFILLLLLGMKNMGFLANTDTGTNAEYIYTIKADIAGKANIV